MYVSINDQNEIKLVGISTDPSLTSLFVSDDNNPFEGWSEAKICCYKVNVHNGIVTMMTPYVDSRLLEHFDQLGLTTEVNSDNIAEHDEQILETQIGVCEAYDQVTVNTSQVLELEIAVVELYEMLLFNGENSEDEDVIEE